MPLSNVKVLLVEDNKWNSEIATDLLVDMGATVHLVVNGKEAVDVLSEASAAQFDVVLMDVEMPVMNGYDATRAIRAMANPEIAKIPIIAMTAYAFEADKQEAFDAGMDGHIAKPVRMDMLVKLIQSVLG